VGLEWATQLDIDTGNIGVGVESRSVRQDKIMKRKIDQDARKEYLNIWKWERNRMKTRRRGVGDRAQRLRKHTKWT
jgi:hypothetical protein